MIYFFCAFVKKIAKARYNMRAHAESAGEPAFERTAAVAALPPRFVDRHRHGVGQVERADAAQHGKAHAAVVMRGKKIFRQAARLFAEYEEVPFFVDKNQSLAPGYFENSSSVPS